MVERAYLDPELQGEPSDTKGFSTGKLCNSWSSY